MQCNPKDQQVLLREHHPVLYISDADSNEEEVGPASPCDPNDVDIQLFERVEVRMSWDHAVSALLTLVQPQRIVYDK